MSIRYPINKKGGFLMAESNVMTYDRALRILNLSEGFTSEDLKKAHRLLSKKYHESNFVGKSDTEQKEAEERLKKVNAARDFFDEIFIRTGTYFNLESYRLQIANKIKSYYENTTVCDVDLYQEVASIGKDSLSLIPFRDRKYGLDFVLQNFLKSLKKIYTNYKKNFFEKYYIYDEDISEVIDYDVHVETFYEKMLKLKDKYSRKIIFERRVNEEIAPYRNYATCTDNLWELIEDACVHNAILAAKNSKYSNEGMNLAIQNMHQEIDELFLLVDEINAKFNSIREDLPNLTEDFSNEYIDIKTEYAKGEALSGILSRLNKLEKRIQNFKIAQENELVIKGLYDRIMAKYNSVLGSLNPLYDSLKIKKITESFQKIAELFSRCINSEISIDSLLMLDNVTFLNPDEDEGILSSVSKNKLVIENASRLYVIKKAREDWVRDEEALFSLRKEDGIYYMDKVDLYTGRVFSYQITLDELGQNYVSLDTLIDKGMYLGVLTLGKLTTIVTAILRVFVDNESRIIYIDENNSFRICSEQSIGIHGLGIDENGSESSKTEYEDKEYLKAAINLQIDGILKREKKVRN